MIEPSTKCAPLPPLELRSLFVLATVEFGLCLVANGPAAYGYMTDELYYLDCASRLAWGYVDHPPLSVAVLAAWRALVGDAIWAIRMVPALACCAVIFLTGMLAREMGGRHRAQVLAGFGILCAPLVHALGNFYSMNALELLLWTAAMLLVLKLINGASPSRWLMLGTIIGIGLLNKLSMSWFVFGMGVGLIATPHRRWLLTPWPWLAGALALAMYSPNLFWQMYNDWAMFEFMRNSAAQKEITLSSPLGFAVGQLGVMGWPVWIEGLYWLLGTAEGKRFRWAGWLFASVFLLLMLSGTAKIYYLAPAYPIVFAAAGVRLESVRSNRWRAAVAAWAIGGIVSLPFTMSLVPVDVFVGFQKALGMGGIAVDADDASPFLQQGHAQMLHGQAVTEAVASAYARLSADDRARVGILTDHFGEAGGLNFYGPARGLPRAIGTHVSYWLWGPGDVQGDFMLILSDDEADLRRRYREVEQVSTIECPYCMTSLTRKSVYLCRRPVRPLAAEWPSLKRYF